jgi:hypothetical protein
MLLSKLFRAKKTFTKPNGDIVVDLISSTFNFSNSVAPVEGYCQVLPDEEARPDLVTVRVYGDQQLWEALLKYNGVSNPFSLEAGYILLTPPFKDLEKLISVPKNIVEKGVEIANTTEDRLLNPKTVQDKNRLEALKTNVREIVPPNVNTKGNKNVKIRDGKVIFGEDVTTVNKNNCPTPISSTRLISQLIKSNLL